MCFTALYPQTSTHHRSRSTSRVPPSDTAHRKSRPAACRVQLTRRASSFLQASSLPARTVICGTMQPLNPNMPFASQGRVQQPSGRPCPCRLITFLPHHQCPDPALSPHPEFMRDVPRLCLPPFAASLLPPAFQAAEPASNTPILHTGTTSENAPRPAPSRAARSCRAVAR